MNSPETSPLGIRLTDSRYRLLFEASPQPAWIIDRQSGAFLLVNDAALRQYGYTVAEFRGMTVEDVGLPSESLQLDRYVPAQPSEPFVVPGSWHHRRKNQSVFRVQLNVERVVFAGRPALLTFVLDPDREGALEALKVRESQLAAAEEALSEGERRQRVLVERQQELEAELRSARDNAEAATRATSEFLASMSHQIRTPINAVLGLTEIVLDSELTPEQRRHLEMVGEAGDGLLTLLNDILDLSKVEAGRLELERVSLDLPVLVHAGVSLFAMTAQERGLELVVDVGRDVPRWVVGDPSRLRQVLATLLGNAIKFTQHGEVAVTVRLEGVANGQAELRLAVRDSGVGIPPNQVEVLSKEFGQLDASTTHRYGGTGLGLAIARRLAHLMGGAISVSSEVGRGSEFGFTVSLMVDEAAASRAGPAPVGLDGVRVLVVDDNATSRRLLRDMLREAGAAVEEAERADDAVATLEEAVSEQRPVAVVVLDSRLSNRDGWILGREIRSNKQLAGVRLLMLTGCAERDDAETCRTRGIDGFLVKPVSRRDLVETVGSVLAGKTVAGVVAPRHTRSDVRAHLRILLAEDNHLTQELVATMLRKRGHWVTIVDNGVKAVEAVATAEFDAVLMDVHMPEMDGFAATAAIRRLPGKTDLPIIALTADALGGEWQRCLAAGMSGYLAKPFKSQDLFAIVEGWGPPPSPPVDGALEPDMDPGLADVEGFRANMREAGVEHAVQEILDAFVADAPARNAAIAAAVASGRAEEIRSAAHVFKSSAGAIGARSLATQLSELEVAGQENRIADAATLAAGIQIECDAVIGYLGGLRAGAASGV
jgi:PAS domain S-box-containing protein